MFVDDMQKHKKFVKQCAESVDRRRADDARQGMLFTRLSKIRASTDVVIGRTKTYDDLGNKVICYQMAYTKR